MKIVERYNAVIEYFKKNMPVAETELKYSDSYELTVAVILSAQCTDKRVNLITPAFFKKFPDAAALAKANLKDVYNIIRSCSYPNNKAKNLLGMAKTLVKEFKGVLPSDPEIMQKLPGVGRKTANVLASVLHNAPVIAVDTHVQRVSARIGLVTKAKSPLETEKQLTRHIPPELRSIAHHWLILHGRYTCMARKPNCEECGIRNICKYYNAL